MVNSERNSTWMSSEKDFGGKQQLLKSAKCHDIDNFCDTLDEIDILVCEVA